MSPLDVHRVFAETAGNVVLVKLRSSPAGWTVWGVGARPFAISRTFDRIAGDDLIMSSGNSPTGLRTRLSA